MPPPSARVNTAAYLAHTKGQSSQVIDGAVGELEAEAGSLTATELYKRVLPFSGMGPFTAANVLQLLGVFLPCATGCGSLFASTSSVLAMSASILHRTMSQYMLHRRGVIQIRFSVIKQMGRARQKQMDILEDGTFSAVAPFKIAADCTAGHFERIAADSETLRHLKQFHKPPGLTAKNLQEVAQKVGLTLLCSPCHMTAFLVAPSALS